MGYYRKWKPSKTAARQYADTMEQIKIFCNENGIDHSKTCDSYYFCVNGVNYRVSNHTVESSNYKAYDEFGNKVRELYHPNGREDNTVYITAGKTRIREIYNDLKAGYSLDKRGNRKLKEV